MIGEMIKWLIKKTILVLALVGLFFAVKECASWIA